MTTLVRDSLGIGWAQADITPREPVLIAGQFHARVSEGVADPITATVCALDNGDDHAVMVSCDLVSISHELRDAVRERVATQCSDLAAVRIAMNGTHTHTGPDVRLPHPGAGNTSGFAGVDLPVMAVEKYIAFAADRIADAVIRAWGSRASGRLAFGQGYAVVGRNRRWVDVNGESCMYGNTDTPGFSHIEGYEDHSVNVLATYDQDGELNGVIVNVPCPSQVSESDYVLSADYWHETRTELRRRFGESLPVLAQCSAAGDQSPHLLFEKRAAARMLALTGRSEREEIARRIARAVEDVLAVIAPEAISNPVLRHHVETLDLPLTRLTEADVQSAQREADVLRAEYEQERRRLEERPGVRDTPRWYRAVTRAHRRMRWFLGVVERYRQQTIKATLPVEIHVIRIGNMVIATNPFEYYLDFGIRIKARSSALQTFLVQLTGPGTYVPSPRSLAGGGYGSIPASNPVGPDGGKILANRTVEIIDQLYAGDRG